jgi:uncharacterized membrane protein
MIVSGSGSPGTDRQEGPAVPLDGSPADEVARFAGPSDLRDEVSPAAPEHEPANTAAVPARAAPEAAGAVPAKAAPEAAGAVPAKAAPEAARQASPAPARAESPAGHRAWRVWLGADPVPWLIALAVFAAYTTISIFRYLRRDPTSWDLGIFTEYVKRYAHLQAPIVNIRGAGFDLLGDHFHPIVAVLAPFFWLFPTSATLLVAQALLTAISIVPVYRAGAELLGVGAGRAICAAYGFSWGLQQMVDYDFHEIAFAVPLLAFSLSALVRRKTWAAVMWALPLVFVKEDQGFTLAAIGLIIAFSYRERGLGLFLSGWGLFWSFLAIVVIIPHFNPDHTYAYWSQAGAISPVHGHFTLGGLWTRLSDGASTKLPTLALILLPTAFIALRSPLVLAALPSLLLRFIGENPAYWGTQWHYNATVMPIVFIAAIDAMARLRARQAGRPGRSAATRRRELTLGFAMEHYGAAAMLAVCAALAFQFPLSSLWTPGTYYLGPHVAAENAAMAKVPNGAQVATDLDLLAPLAARTNTYWLGNYATNPVTQYVVFDTESTDWQPPPAHVLSFVEELEHGAKFRQIYASNGVYVFIHVP